MVSVNRYVLANKKRQESWRFHYVANLFITAHLIRERAEPVHVKRKLLMWMGTNPFVYDKTDFLDSLRRVTREVGHSPSVTEYKKHRQNSEPSIKTIYNRFGSWNEAKQQVGLGAHIRDTYSAKDVKRALIRVAREVGHSPSISEYKNHRKDSEPSQTRISNIFDSWDKAKQQVGLDTRGYSQEDVITALTRVADKLGHSPTRSEYREHKRDSEPSHSVIYRLFESWTEAKQQVGLDTYHDGSDVNCSYGPGWSRIATDIVQQYGECLNCGESALAYAEKTGRRLDVHHIHKSSSFFEMFTDEQIKLFEAGRASEQLSQQIEHKRKKANHQSNLVPLCRDCHHSKVEPLSVRKQVEMLGVEMPEVNPEKACSSAERSRLQIDELPDRHPREIHQRITR